MTNNFYESEGPDDENSAVSFESDLDMLAVESFFDRLSGIEVHQSHSPLPVVLIAGSSRLDLCTSLQ